MVTRKWRKNSMPMWKSETDGPVITGKSASCRSPRRSSPMRAMRVSDWPSPSTVEAPRPRSRGAVSVILSPAASSIADGIARDPLNPRSMSRDRSRELLTPTGIRGEPAASARIKGSLVARFSPGSLDGESVMVMTPDWKSICQMAACSRLAPSSPSRDRQASSSGGCTQSMTLPTSMKVSPAMPTRGMRVSGTWS